jgi:DNA-binding response OmpR family regulator
MTIPETATAMSPIVLACGDARIVFDGDLITVNGTPIQLTPTQHRTFAALVNARGERVSKVTLLGIIGSGSTRTDTINVYLSHIRKALHDAHPDAAGILRSESTRTWIPAEHFHVPAPMHYQRFTCGDASVALYYDTSVQINGTNIHLTERLFDVLLFLAEHKGTTCTKEMLMEHFYGTDKRRWPDYKIMDVFICNLRKRLAAAHEDARHLIRTDWGCGYRFDEQVARPTHVPRPGSLASVKTYWFGSIGVTKNDLPMQGCRWVISRKVAVVVLLQKGEVTMEELLSYYPGLTEDTVKRWEHLLTNRGIKALRVTKLAA